MIDQLIDGKYRLISVLGQGGMGTVFAAKHTGTGRRVALKLMSRELAGPDILGRFQREALAAGAIDTQHIVQVLDTGTDPATGAPFIVLEYLNGCDLEGLLERKGVISVDLALRVVLQACVGLSKAHEAGVVHRDIKPANLFLAKREGGEVILKLLDFGVAKVKAAVDLSHTQAGLAKPNIALTSPGGVLGSPAYMSPEQARGLTTIDHRTDLWSIGVVLYQALSGHLPFNGDSVGHTMFAICSEDPAPIESLVPKLRPEVAAIVRRTLQRDPQDRYQHAKEMIAAIEALLPNGWTINQRILDPADLESGSSTPPPSSKAGESSDATMQAISSDKAIVAPKVKITTSDEERRRASQGEVSAWLAATQERHNMVRDGADPAEVGDPLLDAKIDDRYHLIKLLGMGGMGAVYEAVDGEGRHYALKVILPDVALKSTEATRRFVLEARAGLKLQNEYITQLIEAGSDDQRKLPFIVMELLKGIDVGKYVSANGPMAPGFAARIFRQACLGLAAAHEIGMIHRDIKPENIFLHEGTNDEIIPKLCDFGIAKQDASLEEMRATSLTQTGSMLGSPMYMSPEQAENPRRADARSDIWSMGISLYEVLCGHPAWVGCATVGELLLRLYTKEVPPLQDVAPWVDADLADVVHKALRRSPIARYQTASEFAEALAPLAAKTSLATSMVLALPPATMRFVASRTSDASSGGPVSISSDDGPAAAAPKSGGRAMLFGLGALVLMVGGGGFLWFETQRGVQPSLPAPAQTASASTSAPETVTASVTIRPKDATATVDGEPATVDDGVLHIERRPGTAVVVGVQRGDKHIEKMLVITANGIAMPNTVELMADAPASSAVPTLSGHDSHFPRPAAPTTVASSPTPSPDPSPAPVGSSPRFKKTWNE